MPQACRPWFSRGGPWRGVVTAEPTDRGGPPRKNQEFNHEWPRNQRRAVTSSEPGHPLPPGALPTTAPPLVSYINILFTSLRAAITRCASLVLSRRERRETEKERKRAAGEKWQERNPDKNGRRCHMPRIVLITRRRKREIDGDLEPKIIESSSKSDPGILERGPRERGLHQARIEALAYDASIQRCFPLDSLMLRAWEIFLHCCPQTVTIRAYISRFFVRYISK